MSRSLSTAADALADIRRRLATAQHAAGRDEETVELIAVSKTFEAAQIEPVIEAGQRLFGENRVQEAKGKWPGLKSRWPDLELHLIGPLQTNKVADALDLFDVIHTLDREKLARSFVKERARGRLLPRMLIQVNIGEEPQKAGIAPQALDAFVALSRDELGLPVVGLMCIPPVDVDPAPFFAELRRMAARHDLPHLSMGMSADFEIAVQHGATYVRVGSAIFGAR